MRRPRHKLQISTFPFLAVLLGAMGSLIFLLMVMDRRAKIVAQNKVRESQSARLAATSEADRLRQEAWEKQRRQLHGMLAAQDRDLRTQLQATSQEAVKSVQHLQATASAHAQLQAQIDAEQAKLLQERDELQRRQAALLGTAQVTEASKAELARLTRDLLGLEQTLDAMKRLKQQQQPSYSLVPYRGQRGANRLPIYVECTQAGMIFLPDGERLIGSELDLGRIRSAVESRHGPLVKQKRAADPFRPDPASEQPYVLFLIRPDGIGSYYRGQNALRGFQIDFGYELVDADWKLDVPTGSYPLPSPPWGEGPGVRGGPPTVGRVPGSGDKAVVPGVNVSPPTATNVLGSGNAPGPGVGSPIGSAPKNNPQGFASTAKTGANPGDIGFAPASAKAPPGLFRPAQPSGTSVLEGATPGLKVPGALAKGQETTSDDASAKRQANDVAHAAPFSDQPGTSAKRQATGAPPAAQGAEQPAAGNAMNRLVPPSPVADKQPKVAAPPPSRVVGNRDFIVTLACYAEGVIVQPGGASFTWDAARDKQTTDEALVRTVVDLVNRRQATVRAGEPPYRPVLRFEVRDSGRRTYHRAYPLFEYLRLPMVREDVDESP